MEVVIKREGSKVFIVPVLEDQLLAEMADGEMRVGKMEKTTDDFLSPAQRNSLHKYCRLVAKDLNDCGITQQQTNDAFKDGADIDNTMESVKEGVWRRIQKIVLGINSTENLKTHQVNEVLQPVQKFLAQRLGITTAWPDRHNQGLDEWQQQR